MASTKMDDGPLGPPYLILSEAELALLLRELRAIPAFETGEPRKLYERIATTLLKDRFVRPRGATVDAGVVLIDGIPIPYVELERSINSPRVEVTPHGSASPHYIVGMRVETINIIGCKLLERPQGDSLYSHLMKCVYDGKPITLQYRLSSGHQFDEKCIIKSMTALQNRTNFSDFDITLTVHI